MQKTKRQNKKEVLEYLSELFNVAIKCNDDDFELFVNQVKDNINSPIYPLIIEFIECAKQNRI